MVEAFIKGPFLPRKASQSLREQLIGYLNSGSTGEGEPFFSDTHLMRLSGLSRQTVRRALDDLRREGWIDRRPGKGSFVGPRVGRGTGAQVRAVRSGGKSVVRLALVAFGMSNDMPDWYSHAVLQGIDEVASELAISIEVLGSNRANGVKALSQRLVQGEADVLAVLPSSLHNAMIIAEAGRLGIPVILTGTRLMQLGLPTIHEDGVQGAAMAVRHLAGKGHRRIGLLQQIDQAPWVFDRREGYLQGLREAGIAADERLVCWLSQELTEGNVRMLEAFLAKEKPSALLMNSAWHCRTLGRLMGEGKLRIPEDVSLVSFDQQYHDYQVHLHVRPTVVALPLREMGRRLAYLAREVAEGRSVEGRTVVACELIEGDSVAELK